MVDADEEGYLLQILLNQYKIDQLCFFEIIQRMGAKGFGAGNFKAFESIEREQNCEERYKILFFLHYEKITIQMVSILLCVKLFFSLNILICYLCTRKMEGVVSSD
jgi:hypothetical protein